jgi:hypothetical protein
MGQSEKSATQARILRAFSLRRSAYLPNFTSFTRIAAEVAGLGKSGVGVEDIGILLVHGGDVSNCVFP